MVIKHKTAQLAVVAVISAIIATSFISLTNQFEQKALSQIKTSSAAGATNATSTGSKNTTTSSNPLANVPIIGKLFGGK